MAKPSYHRQFLRHLSLVLEPAQTVFRCHSARQRDVTLLHQGVFRRGGRPERGLLLVEFFNDDNLQPRGSEGKLRH